MTVHHVPSADDFAARETRGEGRGATKAHDESEFPHISEDDKSVCAGCTPDSDAKVRHTKVLIIGGGPAGYTAALYAARAGLDPILVEGPNPGGQLMITGDVENYPGFADVVQGPWLMDQMRRQTEKVGAQLIFDTITKVDVKGAPFSCKSESGITYTAETIIVATGAKAKWLEIPSEKKFWGHGVSACATCDGFFFRGLDVVVVGGGNTAVEDAMVLTHHARHVTLVHRRDSLRAQKILQDRLVSNPKISTIWNHVVEEIIGDESPKKVTGVRLKDVNTGHIQTLKTDGVFVAIGHKPETSLFEGQLTLEGGYIVVEKGTTKTNISGVFAAGDVQDYTYRQAVTAAGQGCMAALEAEKFLMAQGIF